MLVSIARPRLVTYFIPSPVAVSKTCSSYIWCRVLVMQLLYAAYVVGFINLKPDVPGVYVLKKRNWTWSRLFIRSLVCVGRIVGSD